jgi:hypothetical protein
MWTGRDAQVERYSAGLFRSHVENCLKSVVAQAELAIDDDGDYPFGTAVVPAWVCIVPGDPPAVRVYAYVVEGVRRTTQLLTELNEINARVRGLCIYWTDGHVLVDAELSYTAVNEPALGQTMDAVLATAGAVAEMLAIVHGGVLPFADLESEPDVA